MKVENFHCESESSGEEEKMESEEKWNWFFSISFFFKFVFFPFVLARSLPLALSLQSLLLSPHRLRPKCFYEDFSQFFKAQNEHWKTIESDWKLDYEEIVRKWFASRIMMRKREKKFSSPDLCGTFVWKAKKNFRFFFSSELSSSLISLLQSRKKNPRLPSSRSFVARVKVELLSYSLASP